MSARGGCGIPTSAVLQQVTLLLLVLVAVCSIWTAMVCLDAVTPIPDTLSTSAVPGSAVPAGHAGNP